MARRKGKSYCGGTFFVLPHNLVQSPAYAALTGSAVKILCALLTCYNGSNNGFIAFGYRDGKKFGLSINTTKRALNDLADKGFIEKTKAGVYQGNRSEWLLTFLTDNRTGHPKTDKWKGYPAGES